MAAMLAPTPDFLNGGARGAQGLFRGLLPASLLSSGPNSPISDGATTLKGGDPVSHCHYLRTSKAATWILASGEVRAA